MIQKTQHLSNEKRKPVSEMCPICEDWAGKNITFKLCERCRLQSELMCDQIYIDDISLRHIIKRRII